MIISIPPVGAAVCSAFLVCLQPCGDARSAAAERLEGNDGVGVLDTGNDLHLLVDEMADVGLVVDVELDQQVVMAGGGVDLRGNLGLRQRIGHRIGLAELAFELDKEGNHCCRLRECWAQYSVFKEGGYRLAPGKRVRIRWPKMDSQSKPTCRE